MPILLGCILVLRLFRSKVGTDKLSDDWDQPEPKTLKSKNPKNLRNPRWVTERVWRNALQVTVNGTFNGIVILGASATIRAPMPLASPGVSAGGAPPAAAAGGSSYSTRRQVCLSSDVKPTPQIWG